MGLDYAKIKEAAEGYGRLPGKARSGAAGGCGQLQHFPAG